MKYVDMSFMNKITEPFTICRYSCLFMSLEWSNNQYVGHGSVFTQCLELFIQWCLNSI